MSQDELYLRLKGAREKLARAQVLCEAHPHPLQARAMLGEAIDRIDSVGAFLAAWSKFDLPTVVPPTEETR